MINKKRLEKSNLAYAESLAAVVKELGAQPTGDDFGYQYIMNTKAGKLSLSVRPNTVNPGGAVFTRFDDVEAAKAIGLSHLNPYSGKWNHHFFDYPVKDAIQHLRREFSKILPTEADR